MSALGRRKEPNMEIALGVVWFWLIVAAIHLGFDLWYQSVGGDITYVRQDELSWKNRAR